VWKRVAARQAQWDSRAAEADLDAEADAKDVAETFPAHILKKIKEEIDG
jgi:hypothetical protein